MMMLFRLYLLGGLILHKAVWIVMKRRDRAGVATAGRAHPPHVRWARLAKLTVLLLIAVQVFLPDVLPILEEPLTLRIVGGMLYTLGLVIAVLGRVQLGDSWSDIEVGAVAVDRQVVSGGVYRYIRHPIYAGDLLLLVGLELSLNSWLVVAAAALVPPVVVRALQEEKALRYALMGYEGYARRTKRFIPFVV
jgi:protein-S-isoprenylcysteine O-methyltransferase Ste14